MVNQSCVSIHDEQSRIAFKQKLESVKLEIDDEEKLKEVNRLIILFSIPRSEVHVSMPDLQLMESLTDG